MKHMRIDIPTSLGIVVVSILCIFAIGITVFSNEPRMVSTNSLSSKNQPENDGKMLSEINQQAITYNKNGDKIKFHEQVKLM
jgi:hypothetical protein